MHTLKHTLIQAAEAQQPITGILGERAAVEYPQLHLICSTRQGCSGLHWLAPG